MDKMAIKKAQRGEGFVSIASLINELRDIEFLKKMLESRVVKNSKVLSRKAKG